MVERDQVAEIKRETEMEIDQLWGMRDDEAPDSMYDSESTGEIMTALRQQTLFVIV